MSKRSAEKGLAASNIGYGLLIMILAVTIFFYSGSAIIMLILLFSAILILSGMARIINAFSNEELTNSGAIVKFISGILLILITIYIIIAIFIDPSFSVAFVVFIYSIALFIIGVSRIFMGIAGAKYIKWFRILNLIIGIIVVILTLIILFLPDLNDSTTFSMFSIAIFLSGFTRFLLGFTGKEKYKKQN
ncbi:MAG: DUF308 domain-containing protein [Promethearchaeota archaeon]